MPGNSHSGPRTDARAEAGPRDEPPRRSRDAARSRSAILDAAERLFSDRGFRATTLGDIAAEAGLARGTPSYFFGGKERLYAEVLGRRQATRASAVQDAFAPVRAWAATPAADVVALRVAVRAAVGGYLAFLDDHPAYARLVGWEAQSGAERLGAHAATAAAPGAGAERLGATAAHAGPVAEALRAVHRAGRRRGLGDFDPALASVAFVSLCFLPVAHAATFRATAGLDTGRRGFRDAYAAIVTDALMGVLLTEQRFS